MVRDCCCDVASVYSGLGYRTRTSDTRARLPQLCLTARHPIPSPPLPLPPVCSQVRKWTRELLNGYIDHPAVTTDAIDEYITPSSFGQNAGMVGSLTLAHIAYDEAGGRGKGAGAATATTTGGCCKVPSASWAASMALVAAAVVGVGALVVAKASKK